MIFCVLLHCSFTCNTSPPHQEELSQNRGTWISRKISGSTDARKQKKKKENNLGNEHLGNYSLLLIILAVEPVSVFLPHLRIPQHTVHEYVGAICVHAGCYCTLPNCQMESLVISLSLGVLTAEPPPHALKNCIWLLMRDLEVNLYRLAPFRRKMHHQSACRMNVGRNIEMA